MQHCQNNGENQVSSGNGKQCEFKREPTAKPEQIGNQVKNCKRNAFLKIGGHLQKKLVVRTK